MDQPGIRKRVAPWSGTLGTSLTDVERLQMSSMRLVIRPVRLSDAHQVREYCFSMNTLDEVRAQIQSNLEMASRGKIVQLVAEVDGTVTGIVSLVRQEHPLYAHRAEIAELVVHPDYQRRGIARQLVEACRAGLSSPGARRRYSTRYISSCPWNFTRRANRLRRFEITWARMGWWLVLPRGG